MLTVLMHDRGEFSTQIPVEEIVCHVAGSSFETILSIRSMKMREKSIMDLGTYPITGALECIRADTYRFWRDRSSSVCAQTNVSARVEIICSAISFLDEVKRALGCRHAGSPHPTGRFKWNALRPSDSVKCLMSKYEIPVFRNEVLENGNGDEEIAWGETRQDDSLRDTCR